MGLKTGFVLVFAFFLLSSGCGDSDVGVVATGDSGSGDGSLGSDASHFDASNAQDANTTTDATTNVDSKVPPQSESVIVFQGLEGRIVRTCDGGQTWLDQPGSGSRCPASAGGDNCDHSTGSGRGITYDGANYFATFGWGTAGSVKKSGDGKTWTEVISGPTFGGAASGNGAIFMASRRAQRSTDGGNSFISAEGFPGATSWNVRDAGFVPTNGGLFLVVLEEIGSTPEIFWSANAAESWTKAASIPSECGKNTHNEGGFVGNGNTVLLIGKGEGRACRSVDGGKNWNSINPGPGGHVSPTWNETEFLVWSESKLYRSPDGSAWTSVDLVGGFKPNVVARTAGGTFVAIDGKWYEGQRAATSTDGVVWTVSNTFPGGHPLRHVAVGDHSCD